MTPIRFNYDQVRKLILLLKNLTHSNTIMTNFFFGHIMPMDGQSSCNIKVLLFD